MISIKVMVPERLGEWPGVRAMSLREHLDHLDDQPVCRDPSIPDGADCMTWYPAGTPNPNIGAGLVRDTLTRRLHKRAGGIASYTASIPFVAPWPLGATLPARGSTL